MLPPSPLGLPPVHHAPCVPGVPKGHPHTHLLPPLRLPLPSSFTQVLYNLVLLVSLGAGLSALQTSLEVTGGSLLGGACGIGVTYLTLAANGGIYEASVGKAAFYMCFSGAFMFFTTIFRFRFMAYKLTFTFLQLVFAVATCAAYHQTTHMYKFTVGWGWTGRRAGRQGSGLRHGSLTSRRQFVC